VKVAVVIPTYNEAGDIAEVVEGVLAQPFPELEVLVVDDGSPDGTGRLVEEVARRDPRVRLIARRGPRGRGRAGREGYLAALAAGADAIVEMDGDGSHRPDDLPLLVEGLSRAEMILGSRFIPGGGAVGRGAHRDLISRGARWYLRALLGLDYADPTTGFRGFTRRGLEAVDPDSIASTDPFIVTEVLYRARRAGLTVAEVPIVFRDRVHGKSKLKTSVLLKYFFRAARLRFRPTPPPAGRAGPCLEEEP